MNRPDRCSTHRTPLRFGTDGNGHTTATCDQCVRARRGGCLDCGNTVPPRKGAGRRFRLCSPCRERRRLRRVKQAIQRRSANRRERRLRKEGPVMAARLELGVCIYCAGTLPPRKPSGPPRRSCDECKRERRRPVKQLYDQGRIAQRRAAWDALPPEERARAVAKSLARLDRWRALKGWKARRARAEAAA